MVCRWKVRKHGHIMSTIRCLMHQCDIFKKYWVEAVATSICAINRVPSKIIKFDSPYYLIYEKQPDLSYIECLSLYVFINSKTI